jgi:hypothetical protein
MGAKKKKAKKLVAPKKKAAAKKPASRAKKKKPIVAKKKPIAAKKKPIAAKKKPIAAKKKPVVAAKMREPTRAKDANEFHSIQSAGGPYLVMPSDLRAEWWGFDEDRESYERVSRGPDPAHMKEDVAGARALVVASPDEITWAPNASGGVLVQIVSNDAGEPSAVRGFYDAFPDDDWVLVDSAFAVDGSLHCFDAALSGGAVGDAESLELELARGTYRIDARMWHPREGTELTLVRFSKAN